MPDEHLQRVARFYESCGGDCAPWRGPIGWLIGREDRALLDLLQVRPGDTVLDAGCGAGAHARALTARGARVCAVDLSPRLVAAVAPHVAEALVADICSLRLGRRFDRVLCAGVLEFLPDPAACLSHLAAHLLPDPDARLLVLAPRPSPGALLYQLWHRLRNRIHVRPVDFAALDAAAQRAGLRLLARHEDPLGHNLIAAWGPATGPG